MRSNYKTPEWNPRTRRIITVDGEGDNVSGTGQESEPHAYTLLAAADDHGWKDHIARTVSGKPSGAGYVENYGLSTAECLEFLLGLKQNRSDLLVGFSITYDSTMMLIDLPRSAHEDLSARGVATWGKYRIEWTPKQSIRVCDMTSRYVDSGGQERYRRDVRVWDTFAYFQKSFVAVLEDAKEGVLDPGRVAFIADMKTKRGDFASQDDETILRYCYAECEYHSIIVRDLLVQLDRAGFAPNRYYGPGPVVMQFFDKIRLRDYMPDITSGGYVGGMPECIPMKSYYGGRFEVSKIGFCGDGWNHDINSAYPAAMVTLPCLRHGHWERVRQFEPGAWGFYKVGSNTTGKWAPFPYRVPRKAVAPDCVKHLVGDEESGTGPAEGAILYAHGGIRWVGHAEVEVAVKHYGAGRIPIYDGWVWRPDCDHRPLREIGSLYAKRQKAKDAGDGIEKAYKLIINAGYGKTAQGIGWSVIESLTTGRDEVLSSRDGYQPPKFQCYAWAAWITSACRAMVTDIALGSPDDVLSIATDGILTTRQLKELPISKRLGDWDEKQANGIWIGMPGIYTYESPGKQGVKEDFKRRGFSAKHFPADYLRDHWKTGTWHVKNRPEPDYVPTIEGKTMRAFVAIRQAVKAKDPSAVYGRWLPTSKELDFYPLKRIALGSPAELDGKSIDEPVSPVDHPGTVILTAPITLPADAVSAPYKPKQTWEDVMREAQEDADLYYLPEIEDR